MLKWTVLRDKLNLSPSAKEAVLKMFLTLVVATTLGVLIASTIEGEKGHVASAKTGTKLLNTGSFANEVASLTKSEPTPVVRATFPTSVEEEVSHPSSPATDVSVKDVAVFCDSLDLVERPDLADEMVKIASAAYGTPSGLLNGIWHTESHHGINGQTGKCRVMDQYAIRDCWKPGKNTRRPAGCDSPYVFAGETPSDIRWKEPRGAIGNGTRQRQSIRRIADALGIDAWSIKGSCGRSQLHGRPDHRPTFGGCFGNMQITPSEWEADVKAMGYGLSELSPFNVCDSLLVSSYRLKKHHDQKLARYMKSDSWQSRRDEADRLSWLWAGRRYYGSPEETSTNKYERNFKYGRPKSTFRCGWECWDRMEARGGFYPLNDYIYRRGGKKSKSYAKNRKLKLLSEHYASN